MNLRPLPPENASPACIRRFSVALRGLALSFRGACCRAVHGRRFISDLQPLSIFGFTRCSTKSLTNNAVGGFCAGIADNRFQWPATAVESTLTPSRGALG